MNSHELQRNLYETRKRTQIEQPLITKHRELVVINDPQTVKDILLGKIEELPHIDKKKVAEGITFAEEAHYGQHREISQLPYIVHPLRATDAAIILIGKDNISTNEIVAMLLHDTIEDNEHVTQKIIQEKFGDPVAMRVVALTREGTDKEEYYRDLHRIDIEHPDLHIAEMKTADRLDNIVDTMPPPKDVEPLSDPQNIFGKTTVDTSTLFIPLAIPHRLELKEILYSAIKDSKLEFASQSPHIIYEAG